VAIFAYKAMDQSGRIVRGEVDALNVFDLEVRLKRLDLDLIVGKESVRSLPFATGRVPVRERIHFCFHLEQLLRSGVPLVDALADLRDSTDHVRMREVIAGTVESIEGGRSLSQALSEHGQIFDPVFCSLVRAGEASGNLPEVLSELTEVLKREDELGAYVYKLAIYPTIVLAVTLLAVFVAMIYVVPELARLFRSSGVALPLHTRMLIAISGFTVRFWPALVAGCGAGTAAAVLLVRTSPTAAHAWDRLKLRLPLFGDVYRKIILSRFANLFAMMYSSGIPIVDTIRISQDIVGNLVIKGALERIEQLIVEGQNITGAFFSAGLFPPLVIRMLRVGEHTGSLDQALQNVSYFYERDVRESIGRLQALLEPLLILVLGAVMLWVALSVLGPIYDVITKMKV
jgi:type IV pilus assembly protein PilC